MAPTAKKKTPVSTSPARSKALKLTKDTLRDLAATTRQARQVKGGLTKRCPVGGDGGGTILVA